MPPSIPPPKSATAWPALPILVPNQLRLLPNLSVNSLPLAALYITLAPNLIAPVKAVPISFIASIIGSTIIFLMLSGSRLPNVNLPKSGSSILVLIAAVFSDMVFSVSTTVCPYFLVYLTVSLLEPVTDDVTLPRNPPPFPVSSRVPLPEFLSTKSTSLSRFLLMLSITLFR